MKKLILIALALVTIQVSAQNKRLEQQRKSDKQEFRKGGKMKKGQMMKDFTPNEMAQLHSNKMTLPSP